MKILTKRFNLIFRLFIGSILIGCMYSCTNENKEVSVEDIYNPEEYSYNIDFTSFEWKPARKADSLLLQFRIINEKGEKIFLENPDKIVVEEFNCKQKDKSPKLGTLNEIRDKGKISDDILFSFIIDRGKSISEEDMSTIKNTVHEIINELPDSAVFISFLDGDIGQSRLITKDNFSEFENEFKVAKTNKNLYQSIEEKFVELSSMGTLRFTEPKARYLIVFTDGKVNPSEPEIALANNSLRERLRSGDNSNVIIHAFRYGDDNINDGRLENICISLRKDNLRGNFYPSEKAFEVLQQFAVIIDELTADYELVLLNPPQKRYTGQELLLKVVVGKDQINAGGVKKYSIGSSGDPIVTGYENVMLYVFLGLIILFLVFFILQVIVPYISYKLDKFDEKYVKDYEPIDDGYEECYICQDRLKRGDKVVVRCVHKTHLKCWQENGYKCVEYGQNCDKGIQHFFDKDKPFDLKKSPYYLKWVIAGMFAGLFTWILYKLILSTDFLLFENFSEWLVNTFYNGQLDHEGNVKNDIMSGFIFKIRGFLLVGMLLGFLLTFMFSWINDFRQKKGGVFLSIFLRGLAGAFFGFLSFLIGSVICILSNAYGDNPLVDWIPWLLFGAAIGLCISVKTTIKIKHALIGGILSGILSFVVLLSTSYLGSFGVMLSFMLCSAIIGISIVTVHHTAQKYFLKYKGEKKQGEIAIHKWMSVIGGSNEVTIGKAGNCIIQMNWDKNESIQDKQAKLYIDKKRNMPVLKVLENGMSYDGRDAKKDNEFILKDGVKFNIGDTEFQYVEKI